MDVDGIVTSSKFVKSVGGESEIPCSSITSNPPPETWCGQGFSSAAHAGVQDSATGGASYNEFCQFNESASDCTAFPSFVSFEDAFASQDNIFSSFHDADVSSLYSPRESRKKLPVVRRSERKMKLLPIKHAARHRGVLSAQTRVSDNNITIEEESGKPVTTDNLDDFWPVTTDWILKDEPLLGSSFSVATSSLENLEEQKLNLPALNDSPVRELSPDPQSSVSLQKLSVTKDKAPLGSGRCMTTRRAARKMEMFTRLAATNTNKPKRLLHKLARLPKGQIEAVVCGKG